MARTQSVGSLTANFSGDSREFVKAATKGADSLKRVQKQARATKTSLSAVAKLGPALAGAFSVAAIAKFTSGLKDTAKTSADFATGLVEASRNTGLMATELEAVRAVLEQDGLSFTETDRSLIRLQKSVSDASVGLSTAKRAFEGLGLSVQDLQAMSPAQLFEVVGTRLARLESQTDAARIAQDILGRSGGRLLGTFRLHGEALGTVIKAADEATGTTNEQYESLKDLTGEFTELNRQLQDKTAQALVKHRDLVLKAAEADNKWLLVQLRIKTALADVVPRMLGGTGATLDQGTLDAQEAGRRSERIAELERIEASLSGKIAQGLKLPPYVVENLKAIREELAKLREEAEKAAPAVKVQADVYGKVNAAAEYYTEGITNAKFATQGLTAQANANNEALATGRDLLAADKAAREAAAEAAMRQAEALKEAVASMKAYNAEALRASQQIRGGGGRQDPRIFAGAGDRAENQARLDQWEADRIAAEETAEALKEMYGELAREAERSAERQAAAMEGFINRVKLDFRDLEGTLMSLINELLREFLKLGTEGQSSVLSGLWGAASRLLGSLGGGGGGGLVPGPHRAFGGPVAAGQAYTVGEMGRETFVPESDGYVFPHGAMGGFAPVFAPQVSGLDPEGLMAVMEQRLFPEWERRVRTGWTRDLQRNSQIRAATGRAGRRE